MARINRSGGAVGAAVVAVSLLAGLTTSAASAQQLLTCGDLVECSTQGGCRIDAAGEVEFFTFQAQVGDDIFLTLVQTGGFDFGVHPQATLFDPNNRLLLTFNANSTEQLTIEKSGT